MHRDHCATTLSNEYTSDRKYYSILQGLTHIPTNIPTAALEVYIRGNDIDKIQANAFSGLSECTRLDLQYNRISEVELTAFNQLTALIRLDLSDNQIRELKSGTFDELKALNRLYLHDNDITELRSGKFNGLGTLKW